MMNVELVTHNPTGTISGIGRYVRELQEGLAQRNVTVQFVRPIAPPLTKFFSFLYHLPLGLENHQPGSLVHFTQIMGCAQMLWRPLHPAVATVHDLGVLVCPEDEQLFNRFDRFILNLQIKGLQRMDHFAVNSDFTRDSLVKHLGISDKKIHFVQLGVDSEHFRPLVDAKDDICERYNLPFLPDAFNILYVGSELPRKNVGLLLGALSILSQQGYDVRLIKVGGAGGQQWRQKTLAAVEQYGLQDRVSIVDVVPEDDLPRFYNAVDLCVTPTLLEGGFAWLAMEAMACQKPVVATNAAHIPKDAQSAAIIVPSRDLEAMAEAIKSCYESEALRCQMSNAGRQVILNYTWERTIKEMMGVYEIASRGEML